MKRATPTWMADLRARKAAWREQVFKDKEVRGTAFKIAYAMSDPVTMRESADEFRREGKMFVWPSYRALRETTGVDREAIGHAIKKLIERGHLKKLGQGNQFTGSSMYRLLVKADG